MRSINKIILHCSATIEGKWFEVADIDRWHKQRGFKSVGYHYVILLDGTLQTGRPEAEIGAHTVGYNLNSIGVCYIGGLDANKKAKDTRTAAQKQAIIKLVKQLTEKYTKATIHGHREFAKKDCPCFDVNKEFTKQPAI